MSRVLRSVVIAAIASSGCGELPRAAPLTPNELMDRLSSLPGVASVNQQPTSGMLAQLGYSYYVLEFNEPVDHTDPASATFQMRVSLLHRDERGPVPMIVLTSG